MKRLIAIFILMGIFGAGPTLACTTMLVTRGASQDGSVIVAHSDDSELFDQRLVYVPAADHKPGSLRNVYYDAASLGERPEYHGGPCCSVMSAPTGGRRMSIPINPRVFPSEPFLRSPIPMRISTDPTLL